MLRKDSPTNLAAALSAEPKGSKAAVVAVVASVVASAKCTMLYVLPVA